VRVLMWILERSDGGGSAVETPIGFVPRPEAIDRRGLALADDTLQTLLKVDAADWVEAVEGQEHFLCTFGAHLPAGMWQEHEDLGRRIRDAVTHHHEDL
jgi:phosphoenolpyruvate carboxykinase (GTP)